MRNFLYEFFVKYKNNQRRLINSVVDDFVVAANTEELEKLVKRHLMVESLKLDMVLFNDLFIKFNKTDHMNVDFEIVLLYKLTEDYTINLSINININRTMKLVNSESLVCLKGKYKNDWEIIEEFYDEDSQTFENIKEMVKGILLW